MLTNNGNTAFNLPKQPKIKIKPAPPDQRQIAVVPLRAIRDTSLNHAAIRVLALVCSYANRAGITWVGQERLAKDIGVGFRAISRQINILKKKKYIEILVKGGKLSHTATMRVVFNPEIKAEDAIALQTEDVRSPDMRLIEELEMTDVKVKKRRTIELPVKQETVDVIEGIKKASKRAPKRRSEAKVELPSQVENKGSMDRIVEHNNCQGIVQEVYRNVFLKEKVINDLDLKGFEWIAMAEILESELKECLELWLRARTGEPDSILEFSKSLLQIDKGL